MQANKVEESYQEALRYIDNAKQILREKALKRNHFYTDAKYVKMASHIAYTGVLLALKIKVKSTNFPPPKNERWDYYYFVDFLRSKNNTILKYLNEVYNILHLYGGYDGGCHYKTIQTGLDLAIKIIDWCKSTSR